MFEYHCDCRSTEGTFKKTKVFKFGDSRGLCKYCEHYPLAKPSNMTKDKVIKFFKDGYSQKNIAKLVGIKPNTVRYHLLIAKLVKPGCWTDETQTKKEDL